MKLSKNPLAYSINLFLYVVAVKYNKENIYLGFFVDRESDLSFCCLENGLWREYRMSTFLEKTRALSSEPQSPSKMKTQYVYAK